MKILVVNPNTSASMTDRVRRELEVVKGRETELTVVNPMEGPAAIESAEDEALAIPPMLELIRRRRRATTRSSSPASPIPASARPAKSSPSRSSASRSRLSTSRCSSAAASPS